MPSLGTLSTTLTLKSGQFGRRVDRAQGQLRRLGRQSRKTVNTLGRMTPAVAAVGVAIGANLISKAGKAGQELRTLAKLSDASTKEFQRNAAAARTVGIQSDKLADVYKDVNDRVGDFIASGAGPMADFFENIAPQVGVTAQQFERLSGPKSLQLFVDSLEKANVSQQQMTFYMEALSSESSRLLPLLRNGGEEMQRLGERAEEAGNILSRMEIERLAQMEESLDRATNSASTMAQSFASELSPVVIALSNQFVDARAEADNLADSGPSIADKVGTGVGFAMDAVAGIQRAFQVAGRSVALFALGVQENMLMAADFILNRPIQAINELNSAFSSIPFVGDIPQVNLSGWGKEVQSQLRTVRGAIQAGKQDIHEILMEPLPSVGFGEQLEQAQAQLGGAMSEEEKEKDRKRYQAQTEMMLERQRERGMKMLEVKATLDNEFAALERATQNRITQITSKGEKERNSIIEKVGEANKAAKEDELSGMLSTTASGLRSIFGENKKASIAIAALKRFESIASAYAWGSSIGGPPAGAAAAATAGVAQLATLNSAKSTSIGGGNSSAGGGSAGGGSTSLPAQSQQQEPQRRETNVTVSLLGGGDGTREAVGGIIEQLNKEIEEGGRISGVRMA